VRGREVIIGRWGGEVGRWGGGMNNESINYLSVIQLSVKYISS